MTKIRHTLEMVRFSHSIFALPFALSSFFLAAPGIPPLHLLLLVILCMILARNTAMAFNRLVDAKFDAQNPRTKTRHIPAGILGSRYVLLFILINAVLFVTATWWINRLAFDLAPLALFIVCFYSLTKRFTHATQIFLGFALGIAPIAAWIARTGDIAALPVCMGLGVLFWVAGFDVLYALQDEAIDREMKLKSLVVRLGLERSLTTARLFHVVSFVFFVFTGVTGAMSPVYFGTVTLIGLFMLYEHSLIKPGDLSRINAAFFTMNGLISLAYLAGCLVEISLRRA